MGKTTKMWDRVFLGKTEGFANKEEEKLEKKHLKAYIKGRTRFKHGKTLVPNQLTGKMEEVDKWYDVKEQLTQNQ